MWKGVMGLMVTWGEKYLFPMVGQVTAREESGVFSPEHAYVFPS